MFLRSSVIEAAADEPAQVHSTIAAPLKTDVIRITAVCRDKTQLLTDLLTAVLQLLPGKHITIIFSIIIITIILQNHGGGKGGGGGSIHTCALQSQNRTGVLCWSLVFKLMIQESSVIKQRRDVILHMMCVYCVEVLDFEQHQTTPN